MCRIANATYPGSIMHGKFLYSHFIVIETFVLVCFLNSFLYLKSYQLG